MSYRISEEASKTDAAPLSHFFLRAGTSRNEFDVPARLMKFDRGYDIARAKWRNGNAGLVKIKFSIVPVFLVTGLYGDLV